MIQEKRIEIPMTVSWYLSDIGRMQGVQELFMRQSPQRLKVLREHAIAQSAISSNRIEGVEIDRKRVGTVVFGHPALRDRDEIEIAGYRDALNLIHRLGAKLHVSEETMLKLHASCRGEIWDSGKYKDKSVDIVEKRRDGSQLVRFKTVSPKDTPRFSRKLMEMWARQIRERELSHLLLLAAFNLDFLCIHPFRDGNGRVSRLLLLLTCYHIGIEVGRYISLERLIEDNKERYYETLKQSSQGWHEGKHDPWPFLGFLLFIIKKAYDEFEDRAGQIPAPKGEKTEMLREAINKMDSEFSVSELQNACPGVGIDMIRLTLKRLKAQNIVRSISIGRNAKWKRIR